VLALEAQGGSTQELYVRRDEQKLRVAVQGATLRGSVLTVEFPKGSGYQQTTVTLRW
jgi:hypothetical protein